MVQQCPVDAVHTNRPNTRPSNPTVPAPMTTQAQHEGTQRATEDSRWEGTYEVQLTQLNPEFPAIQTALVKQAMYRAGQYIATTDMTCVRTQKVLQNVRHKEKKTNTLKKRNTMKMAGCKQALHAWRIGTVSYHAQSSHWERYSRRYALYQKNEGFGHEWVLYHYSVKMSEDLWTIVIMQH